MINIEQLNKIFEYRDGKLYWKIANGNRVKVGQQAGYLNNKGYRMVGIKKKSIQSIELFLQCIIIIFPNILTISIITH